MTHQVVLTWTAPTTGDAPTSYDVKRAPVTAGVVGTFASIASPEPTATTYTDTAVVAGQEYAYEVCSVNAAGESTPCPDITVTIPVSAPNPPTGLTGTPS
jgi:fibronectin type 3 domain-containing protein